MSLLFILLLTIISMIFFISRFGGKPYPPGPRRLPVIGNTLMMACLTHRGLAKLASRYGGLFYLRMGAQDIVVVSTPDMARQILQTHQDQISNRPTSIALDYLSYGRANMAFADYSPWWRQMRKICVMKLFSRARVESWNSVRDELNHMLRDVASNANQAINLGELVFGFTEKIIYRAAFGSRLSDGGTEFIKIMQEFSKLFGSFNVCDFVPWMSRADPQGLKARLRKARGSLDTFIDSIIDQHIIKRKGKNIGDKDMVDELLAFYTEEGEAKAESDDLQATIKLTKNNIKGIIMDIMFGGTETVAAAIEWAMSELLKNPEELRKTQEELSNVVGLHRCVEEGDLEKLTYLKCVLKETLRLHPPLPFLPRAAAEDVYVAGYYIPAGSRVIINLWAMGHDGKCWNDEPEAFKPSRFLDVGAPDYRNNNFEFIPFGTGRRSCPGMQLGLHAFEMGLAHLLHCFNWELPDGMKPSQVDMSDMYGLSAPKATRLIAVPTPRLLCPIC
ncbi:cytochrome P450 84A1-like [Apium graveolens]|uniref:cytochrome P450 84A1-like n=1 Tax=Apium graveolens TaxID=4045 RepID=UPI002B42FF9B